MNKFEAQIHKDVANFVRRTNSKWPDTVQGFNAPRTEVVSVELEPVKQEVKTPDRDVVIKTPNSNGN